MTRVPLLTTALGQLLSNDAFVHAIKARKYRTQANNMVGDPRGRQAALTMAIRHEANIKLVAERLMTYLLDLQLCGGGVVVA